MRSACTACALKHLGQACVLLNESRQGYPSFIWLAVGHMAEASDELVTEFQPAADAIRKVRIALMEDPYGYVPDMMGLIEFVEQIHTAWTKENTKEEEADG